VAGGPPRIGGEPRRRVSDREGLKLTEVQKTLLKPSVFPTHVGGEPLPARLLQANLPKRHPEGLVGFLSSNSKLSVELLLNFHSRLTA
jgi:hypothetical protein